LNHVNNNHNNAIAHAPKTATFATCLYVGDIFDESIILVSTQAIQFFSNTCSKDGLICLIFTLNSSIAGIASFKNQEIDFDSIAFSLKSEVPENAVE